MVRIYCLSSIIRTSSIHENSINIQSNEIGIENEDSQKGSIKPSIGNLKQLSDIDLNTFKLSEIDFGYDVVLKNKKVEEKIYYMCIIRKDIGLISIKMIQGSINFHSISRDTFNLTVATSKLFPQNVSYDLEIRVRCIKNTRIKGKITKAEENMYEEYLNKIQSICANEVSLEMEEVIKNQIFVLPNSSTQKVLKQKFSDISKLIELLCDPIKGSCTPNIPTNSRYNQRIKCKDFLFVNSSKNVQKKGSRDNGKKNTVIEVNPPSTFYVAFNSKEKEGSIDDIEMDTVINDNPLVSCIPQNDVTSDPDHEATSQKGRKGRPPKYLTKEEKRASLAKNSKKYLEKRKKHFQELQKEVDSLEKEHKTQMNFLRKLDTTNSNCDVIDAENAMKDSLESSNSNEDSEQRHNFDKFCKKTTVQKSRKRKAKETELKEVEITNKKLPHEKEKTLGEVSDLRKQPASMKKRSQTEKDFEAVSSSPEKDAAVSKSYKDGQKETSSMEPHLQQAQCENLKKLQSEGEKQILNDRIIPSETSYPNKNKLQNLSRYFIQQKAARRQAVKKFRQKQKMEMKEMEEKKKYLCQEIKNNHEKMQKFQEQGASVKEVDRIHVA